MMDFGIKKTSELTEMERKEVCELFFRTFGKEKTIEKFNRQFGATVLGYSYHGLMIDGGRIVGCYTAIPFKYIYFGKEVVFALSVDTMIDEKYRGNPYNLKKMAQLTYEALLKDSIPFVFGFPNENIYLVRKKILKWMDIGRLNFYILPIRIGAIRRSLKALNPLSIVYSEAVNLLPGGVEYCRDGTGEGFPVLKLNDKTFMKCRYDDSYRIVKTKDGGEFVYRPQLVDGAKVAYIVDVYPVNKRFVESVVKFIYREERRRIDAVMYVGKLNFSPINLYKVPERYEPKKVYMSGRILNDKEVDERVFDIKNWCVNLANFDVV